jgi:hypothetical protein
MRDDLHRTPALLRPWRSAVRHAARAADADLVAYDMSRAARQQLEVGLRQELVDGLRNALGGSHGQLFPESRLDSLRSIEQLAKHPVERGLVEAARAVCIRSPQTPDIVDAATRVVFSQLVDNGIEHSAAAVRSEFGSSQSVPLRMTMLRHRAECSIELGGQKPPKKMNGPDLLDFNVPSP